MNQISSSRSFLSRLNQSYSYKLFLISIITLVLMIPLGMVRSTVSERLGLKYEVEQELSSKWGQPQTITGPILTIPVSVRYEIEDGKTAVQIQYAHFLPETLRINGELIPEVRQRSIYRVLLYQADVELSGDFIIPEFTASIDGLEAVHWEDAVISIGLSDMRGIREEIFLNCEDHPIRMQAGVRYSDLFRSGLTAELGWKEAPRGSISFSTALSLNGSSRFHVSPLGKETRVHLESSWSSPSFDGQFLPDSHQVHTSGFEADWSIFDLNRNFPQHWIGARHDVNNWSFGLRLIEEVDNYQKNTRAGKYGLLLIALPFIMLFFFEVIYQQRVHPFQYILLGAALTVFFMLLISITEHLGFRWAYIISALACWIIITLYQLAILSLRRLAWIVSALLAAIFLFIYLILQMESYALLAGSIGLFMIIAALMYFSRDIDWYAAQSRSYVD